MKKKPTACTIDAPCKINLHLSVGERRPDGYHGLESLFAPLAFHDTLRFERGGNDGECSLAMNWEMPVEAIPEELQAIPNEKNLVLRAVSLFREKTGFKSGLFIHLDKRVPVGAGLGGGSSDAASCLLALNALAGDALPMEELRELAAILGSDVPFFLAGGDAAFVSGRGELVKPVKTPQGLWVLLAKPGFSSDTVAAFKLLDKMREGLSQEEKTAPLTRENADYLIKTFEATPETWPFYNDFLPVFLAPQNFTTEDTEENHGERSYTGEEVGKAEHYRLILAALKSAGASFSGLSGAGSCCFGVFKDKETAEKAEKELRIPGNFVKLTFFLAQKTIPVLKY